MTERFATGSTTTFTLDHSGTYLGRMTGLGGEQYDYPVIGWATVIGDDGDQRRIGIEPVVYDDVEFGAMTLAELNSLSAQLISIVPGTEALPDSTTPTTGGNR